MKNANLQRIKMKISSVMELLVLSGSVVVKAHVFKWGYGLWHRASAVLQQHHLHHCCVCHNTPVWCLGELSRYKTCLQFIDVLVSFFSPPYKQFLKRPWKHPGIFLLFTFLSFQCKYFFHCMCKGKKNCFTMRRFEYISSLCSDFTRS